MLRSTGYRREVALALVRAHRSMWRQCLLALLAIALITSVFAISYASTLSEDEDSRVGGSLKWHPEASMHDGTPGGVHEYHIIVAIFDAGRGARIQNAVVTATVSGLGYVGTKTIKLQPVVIAGTISNGNFVAPHGTDHYGIRLQIGGPGREHSDHAGFEHQHTR